MKSLVFTFWVTIIVLFNFAFGLAQVPRTISVQGVLSGTLFKSEQIHVIKTSLYAIGAENASLYSQTDTLNIDRDGLFTIQLGKDKGLPSTLPFDKQYVVEFTVNGTVMPMRMPLQSVPYAITSEKVSDNSVELRHLSEGLKQQLQIQEDSKSGKGEITLANYVGGFRSVIAGGDENRTSANFSSILGGYVNNVSGTYGTVAGGQSNSVSGNWSFVGGGQNNKAMGSWSSVTAGRDNTIASSATYATIGGGITNQVGANNGTISGGSSNIVTAQGGTVSGGQSNRAMQTFATVSGGQNNIASGQGSVTVGGMNNKSTSQYSIVSGGSNNEANGNHAIVSGGMNNDANAEFSSIAGGSENIIASSARSSFISGGSNNKINSGMNSGIMGSNNTITSSNNSFTMGTGNSISNASNAMAIGTGNIANGNNEFVVGSFASSSSNPANTSNTAFTGNKRFSVGIGSSSGQRKNAFTVFENGSTLIQGKVMTTDTAFLQNATIAQDLKIGGKIDVQQQLNVADDFTLGSDNQAGTIKLIDQSGNWYTGFTTGTQSQDILYRLPTSPPIGGQVLASGAVNPLNLEWTYPGSISETDPQVGTIATSGVPRWNGTALVTGSLSDDGTNVSTSGTFTSSNLTGTNTGDITIGTASGLSLSSQALSLSIATTTDAGAMSASDKTKLNSIATGAEVNVNADWNAVSGDAEILNKPTLGTMSAETVSDYYTKSQTDAGFQVKDADLSTVATIGTSDQLLKVKNDGSGLEWFTPSYISSYTETDPQVGTIASSGVPRWNGTALVTGSLSDDGTNVSTSGTFTSSNLTGTNTGDITIGTASGLSLSSQALSLSIATTTDAGAMSASDKTKLNSIATGAEVNVNADWNAVSGDAEILNKPTLGTMSAETASDYYTKTQTDAGFQVKDADLTTVATIGTSDQLLKVKNDGSGLEWFTPTYISSYTETDPQVGTIATSGVPRWNGTALVTGSLSDDGTNLTTSGTFTSSNLSGTNTGDITIGTASGLSLTGQALSLATATTTAAGAMSASDKTKLDGIATGAEVNVNADWNAVSGDAEILNKPTLGTMSAETASDYYTKSQTDAGFQVKDADLTTVATIGTSDQLLKVKNDGSGLEWFTPSYISSYTETDPQVGTIASSGVPRWNGTALVTGSLTDDGTNLTTSGTITASNLSGMNTGDITIGTANGMSLTGQALSLATATTTDAGAMSANDKTKLNSIATGAEVNVNADWNAVSGDAEILNKPTLGTMSAEIASDYYTKSQTDAGFQVQDADLTTVATIGTSDQLLKVKNDGSGLEWFTPSYISSYTETDPQVGTIASSGVPRWNGTALVTGSLTDDGTNLTTSGTITASNLSGTNTGDVTIGTASGLSLTGQALSLATATTTDAGAMSANDKTKLNSIATGAEVNVNADWNAVSGDAEILNKPTLGTMSAETASDYYTKSQTDAGFQVKDADLSTVATIGTSDQLLKVKNDGSGLEWFTPSYISSYTETDPQVGTIATSGVPRWNGTALVTGSLTDDGTNVSTSGTFTSSNLTGTNTGDITIGTASGLSLAGQALSLDTATILAHGAMSLNDKIKLNSLPAQNTSGAFLPTKVTAEEKNALINLEAGLIVFCTDCGLQGELQYYTGTQWATFTGDPVASLNGFSKTQIGSDINGNIHGEKVGYKYSIDLSYDGSVLAVGYPSNASSNNNGIVKIFKWNGTIWNQLGGNIVGEAAYDQFGVALALSKKGDTVVIGAPENDGGGTNAGSLRVYYWNNSSWMQLGGDLDGSIINSNGIRLGSKVTISGNGQYISAYNMWGSGNTSVYFYKWDGSSWSRYPTSTTSLASKKIVYSNDGKTFATLAESEVKLYYFNDVSGITEFKANGGLSTGNGLWGLTDFDISSDFNIIALGSRIDNNNTGKVRVFHWNGDIWLKMGSDLLGEAANDNFGSSVSLSSDGNKLIVGAPNNDGNGADSGHARVFQWNGENWVQLSTDIDGEAAGDYCGDSVVISGDGTRVAVGAFENDGGAFNAGHVRVFK